MSRRCRHDGRDHPSDLVRLSRSQDHTDVDGGEVTFDWAAMRRKPADTGASKEAMGASDRFDLAGMRRFVAQHRRVGRANERQAHEERWMVFEESADGETTRSAPPPVTGSRCTTVSRTRSKPRSPTT